MAYIRDIMNKHVVTISKEKSALEAAKLLVEKDISFLVITEGQTPIGILSEADYVKKVLVNDKRASEVTVADIMSPKFRWVEPTTTIEDAVQKMLNNKIRRLVVLEGEKLAGVITQTDLAAHLRSKLLIEGTVKSIKTD